MVTVQIYDDDEPEPNEELEVILASPKNGLRLGDPHRGSNFLISLQSLKSHPCQVPTFHSPQTNTFPIFLTATILIQSSDRASGVVFFESAEDVTLNEPTRGSSSGSPHKIRVLRQPGVFGAVSVPFRVTTLDETGNVTDVAPSRGFVTFNDREVRQTSRECLPGHTR